jgi:hypothetical protein
MARRSGSGIGAGMTTPFRMIRIVERSTPSRAATSSATAVELAKMTSELRRAMASTARSGRLNPSLNLLRLTRPLIRTGARVKGRVTAAIP